ncbi:hypothetical protein Tco_0808140 [Tanacetum coccineum]
MACSIPHSDDEIQALVQKQIDEDMVYQKAILDLALQFDNACTTKEDLRKAYEKCNHILQESRALIDTFLKEGSDKDYELNLSMYRKTAKLEKLCLKIVLIYVTSNTRSSFSELNDAKVIIRVDYISSRPLHDIISVEIELVSIINRTTSKLIRPRIEATEPPLMPK